jgi:PncC family amidohydrolase
VIDSSALIDRLSDAGATVATAESLTGGRLAARFTDAPGSSQAYAGGVVSYATEVKTSVLHVPEGIVEEHGVVSGECAEAMAAGVRALMGTTYALSTTGVAGPDTQEGKPVGTVYVGVAGPAGTKVLELALEGDRRGIQDQTIAAAMSALAAMMDPPPAPTGGGETEDSGLG